VTAEEGLGQKAVEEAVEAAVSTAGSAQKAEAACYVVEEKRNTSHLGPRISA